MRALRRRGFQLAGNHEIGLVPKRNRARARGAVVVVAGGDRSRAAYQLPPDTPDRLTVSSVAPRTRRSRASRLAHRDEPSGSVWRAASHRPNLRRMKQLRGPLRAPVGTRRAASGARALRTRPALSSSRRRATPLARASSSRVPFVHFPAMRALICALPSPSPSPPRVARTRTTSASFVLALSYQQ